jgi:hypothetical protein
MPGDMDFNRSHLGRRKFFTVSAIGLGSTLLNGSAAIAAERVLEALPSAGSSANSSSFRRLFEPGRTRMKMSESKKPC